VSGLVAGGARQLTLDDVAAGPSWREASGAIDAIRSRFGERAIGPASSVEAGGAGPARPGENPWGPGGR
jgi:hypothetical protein